MIPLEFFEKNKKELSSIFNKDLEKAKSYIVFDDDFCDQDDLDVFLFRINKRLIKILNKELMKLFFSIKPDFNKHKYKHWIENIIEDGQGIIFSDVDWHEDDGISQITSDRILIILEAGAGYSIETGKPVKKTELSLGAIVNFNESIPHRVIESDTSDGVKSISKMFAIAINIPNPTGVKY